MNPPLSKIIEGLTEYRRLYGRLLRQKQPEKDRRLIRKKYDRYKKALALLKPLLGPSR